MNVGAFVAVHLASQIAAQEKRVVQQLQSSGAQTLGSAMPLHLKSQSDQAALARLLQRGRVIDAGNGAYYLGCVPEPSARSRAVIIACMLLLIALGVVLVVMLAMR